MPSLEKFNLVENPLGYFNKREITTTDARALVVGSKNVIINDADKVVTRLGYTLDGQARTVTKKIDSSYDFHSIRGLRVVRSFQGATASTGKLQVRTEYVSGTPVYSDILTTLTVTTFAYSSWWNSTEAQDVMLFCDGTNNLRMWSGGLAYVASNTVNTITLSGSLTWKQSGFLSSLAGRAVTVNGISYTYSGGEGTQVLTGVATLPALAVGAVVTQTVVSNTGLTGLPGAYTFDVITTQTNHIWLGCTTSREVYVSKSTSFIDYTYTSPVRLPTDGWKMTFDSAVVGFIEDNDIMRVSAGTSDNYKVQRSMTADGTGETFKITKIPNGAGQAALSQKAIIPVKNGIIQISNEKTVDWITNIENVSTVQSLPLSDPVKNDFDNYDLTGVSGVYINNQLWLAIPAENLARIYDFDKKLWQPPQTLGFSGFTIIDNLLYGHSNSSNETYLLNDGLLDVDVAIEFVVTFAYRSFGERAKYKQYDEYYSELYMSTPTVVTVTHRYEYGGAEGVLEKTISGDDAELMFAPAFDSSLGKNPLGKDPLGGTATDVATLNKYRCIHELKAQDFFESQISFSSEGGQFEILAHGPAVRLSPNQPSSIKR